MASVPPHSYNFNHTHQSGVELVFGKYQVQISVELLIFSRFPRVSRRALGHSLPEPRFTLHDLICSAQPQQLISLTDTYQKKQGSQLRGLFLREHHGKAHEWTPASPQHTLRTPHNRMVTAHRATPTSPPSVHFPSFSFLGPFAPSPKHERNEFAYQFQTATNVKCVPG